MIPAFLLTLTLLFGNPDEATVKYTTKIYPIQDLLLRVPQYSNVPVIDLDASLQRSGNVFRDTTGDQLPPAGRANPQEIIGLIQDFVQPDIWFSDPNCSIRYFQGSLVIRAPESVHQEISTY